MLILFEVVVMRMFNLGFELFSLRLIKWMVFWRVVIVVIGNEVVFIVEMFGGCFIVDVMGVRVYLVNLFFFCMNF